MDALFGSVGFVLFLLGIGTFVINLIKKDQEKRKKGRNMLILGFILFSVGITMDPAEKSKPIETANEEKPAVVEQLVETEVEEPVKTEVEQVVEKDVELPKEVEVKETKVNEKELEKTMGQLAYQLLISNFDGLADIVYLEEDKVFNIIPTDNNLVAAITFFATGNVDLSDDWNEMVDSFKFMSKSMSENIGSGYMINLVNPANTDNTLLTVIDGIVIYNIADEI